VLGRLPAAGAAEGVAVSGAVAYVAGMAAVGLAAMLPLRHATGTRRPLTELAYWIALLDVIVGVSLVATFLAGDPGVTGHWASLRIAHAWLNVFGFVTLVVAGTLVHFAPTVAGSRIRRRRSGLAAIVLLAVAAPAAALGYAAGPGAVANLLVVAGAVAFALGAATLVVHGLQARRDRAGWTTDLDWHRFTSSSLLLAPAWLLAGACLAVAGVIEHGTDPLGWRIDRVGAPLVLGFVLQTLLGSMAHLLPAIGPGSPAAHATQRQLLGRGATARLTGWNVGVATLTAGLLAGSEPLALAGLGLGLASGTATLVLLVEALRTR
jgi:nitrite reductase (NO-forming)